MKVLRRAVLANQPTGMPATVGATSSGLDGPCEVICRTSECDIADLRPARWHSVRRPDVSAASIELVRRFGALVPAIVRPVDKGYEILANVATWTAVQRAGRYRVPIRIVEGLSEADARAVSLADLSETVIDRAKRYRTAADRIGGVRKRGVVTTVAREAGVSRSTVAHELRLLGLPEIMQEAVHIGVLSTGHAKVLLGVDDEDERLRLATQTIEHRLSVRTLERRIAGRAEPGWAPRRSADIEHFERRVGAALGSAVHIDEEQGTLEIRYGGDLEVLQGVVERLGIEL